MAVEPVSPVHLKRRHRKALLISRTPASYLSDTWRSLRDLPRAGVYLHEYDVDRSRVVPPHGFISTYTPLKQNYLKNGTIKTINLIISFWFIIQLQGAVGATIVR